MPNAGGLIPACGPWSRIELAFNSRKCDARLRTLQHWTHLSRSFPPRSTAEATLLAINPVLAALNFQEVRQSSSWSNCMHSLRSLL